MPVDFVSVHFQRFPLETLDKLNKMLDKNFLERKKSIEKYS